MKHPFEVVETREGLRAMRDRESGELMHPVGPLIEAAAIYVEPARLAERLQTGAVTLFDVGLGAGSNAAAAWLVSEARLWGPGRPAKPAHPSSLALARCALRLDSSGHRLRIVSFDRTAEPLALAVTEHHAAAFGFDPAAAAAAQALLRDGSHTTDRTTWTMILGELPGSLSAANSRADVVFWDPFSPQTNPDLWTVAAFTTLRAACSERATVHTYGAATSTRTALLLAGFAVGRGPAIGRKNETTIAAVDVRDLEAPLDRRWLDRFLRSSAPLPSDAPADATERIVNAFR